ncbi:hypothetical protein LPW26_06145 [Rhodopseudomonas sp. HC1]|uniref:DUF4376 domain-containing protein n=1 Tax=Rhodopseudomonas infernalis TaxID=2897386 RepID=UPI001EE89E4B|nr:hypothetical protein [Rhodopseudomonas infernalis]MCG6204208.1 hypothetical protein [Rhodopseudomonas infernalis]
MTTYARCAGVPGAILELVQLPDGITPADAFHPDIAAAFHACPPGAAVGDVLAEDGTSSPPVAPQPTKGELIAYANAAQWSLVTAGKAVTVDEQEILFATSTDGRNLDGLTLMNGKVSRLAQANPPETVLWQIGATEFATIDAADFVTAATEVADWVQSTFDALPQIFATIEAGEITTLAQVDAALAQV